MMFFIVIFSMLSMIFGYAWWRLVFPAGISGVAFAFSVILCLVLLALPFISIFLRFAGHQNRAIFVLTWISFVILGFVTMFFLFLVFRDVMLLAVVVSLKILSFFDLPDILETISRSLFDPVRRMTLVHALNIFLLSVTGLLTLWGILSALSGPRIDEVAVGITGLDDAFDGFRIVQISDLHAGSTVTRKQFRRIIDMTQKIDADMIAFTGDIADGRASTLSAHVEPLGDLHAPYGKFFVTGNHEYYSGVDAWIAEMKKLGFDVLHNSHRVIKKDGAGLIVAGVTDFHGGQFSPDHASNPHASKRGAPDNTPSILLAHQPLSIHDAAEAGFDLVLSGHTHGGQYFPWNFFVALQQPYVKGLHTYGDTCIYVNRGSAFWGPPMRGGVPSEITVITLRKK